MRKLSLMLLGVILLTHLPLFAENDMKYEHYFVRLLGTRDGWPDNMTDREEAVMGEHYLYLKELTAKRKCLMAGPVFEPFGLIVLQVESEAEARDIMEQEPSVVAGVHTYEMTPMRVSLMADNIRPDRYATEPGERVLEKIVVVPATVDEVWWAWTTSEGVKAFLEVDNEVKLRLGGPYEFYFDPSAPAGLRGGEGCRILSFLPKRMLSFEWNAPPSFPELREIRTQVVIFFKPTESGQTKLEFRQLCWGEGAQWDGLYDYFDRAWSYVLDALVKHFS
ncbi:MAG: SRPBCC domain-containing protein [bacterium]